jgi:hypothetical protein
MNRIVKHTVQGGVSLGVLDIQTPLRGHVQELEQNLRVVLLGGQVQR